MLLLAFARMLHIAYVLRYDQYCKQTLIGGLAGSDGVAGGGVEYTVLYCSCTCTNPNYHCTSNPNYSIRRTNLIARENSRMDGFYHARFELGETVGPYLLDYNVLRSSPALATG